MNPAEWERVKRLQRILKKTLIAAGYHSTPAFLIIGVQRGGTTSLHSWLTLHPQLVSAKVKELHYFDVRFYRGVNWYHSMFPLPFQLQTGQLTFEATPRYIFKPAAASRIHAYNPHLKLIVILRNPVDRAFSHWHLSLSRAEKHYRRHGTQTFDEIVDKQLETMNLVDRTGAPINFITCGFYYDQIMRYYALFNREQILILEHQALKCDPLKMLRQIEAFLGVNEHTWDVSKLERLNQTRPEAPMNAETRARLKLIYQPYNEKLYELLGVDYQWE
jgi:hypothetical protein